MNDNERLKRDIEDAIEQEDPWTYEETTTGDLLGLLAEALSAIERLEAELNVEG